MVKRKPKKAIAYIRVSTRGQAQRGGGMQRQREAIRAYAEAVGYDIVETFSDNQSAVGEESLASRPDLQAAINTSIANDWPILVDGLDRLSRHTEHLEKILREQPFCLISTKHGENPDHAVMIADARRAQIDGERISQTTRAALAKKKASGVRLGNPKNLPEARSIAIAKNQEKADAHTRKLAPIIQEICGDQKMTRAQIAEKLNELGCISPRGKPWTAVTLRPQLERILRWETNDRYSDNPMFGMF